ncbi:hypothetical protein FNV43_RR04051 [Rhamnella rubrinervis]|uniref:Uncharacterized protein n=1 Tax=Rhamnella rubrinervis TaxID=2594499 RepID=A0A8K0HJL6_9ROSA|nr:hypothetical protein FNV43_RR04051 [Rhamnella rubrinervis]
MVMVAEVEVVKAGSEAVEPAKPEALEALEAAVAGLETAEVAGSDRHHGWKESSPYFCSNKLTT